MYINPLIRSIPGISVSWLHRRFYAEKKLTLNYYDVLGVSSNASTKEIKTAFYQLSKKYHPDVNPDESNATIKFSTISNAYDTLNDPVKRREYDNRILSATNRNFYENENPFTNSRSTDHRTYNQSQYRYTPPDEYSTSNDSEEGSPGWQQTEEEPKRIEIPKLFLFSLWLTFGLAAVLTANVLSEMHFLPPIPESRSRFIKLSKISEQLSSKP